MNKKSFPMYFYDTANNKGVRFASKNAIGQRFIKGKLDGPTYIGLGFWME